MARTKFKTAPQVAKELGVRYHWLEYWVNQKGLVNPTRAGQYRLFSQAQVDVLKRHLEAMKGDK